LKDQKQGSLVDSQCEGSGDENNDLAQLGKATPTKGSLIQGENK
jgi:hypothetical protein